MYFIDVQSCCVLQIDVIARYLMLFTTAQGFSIVERQRSTASPEGKRTGTHWIKMSKSFPMAFILWALYYLFPAIVAAGTSSSMTLEPQYSCNRMSQFAYFFLEATVYDVSTSEEFDYVMRNLNQGSGSNATIINVATG